MHIVFELRSEGSDQSGPRDLPVHHRECATIQRWWVLVLAALIVVVFSWCCQAADWLIRHIERTLPRSPQKVGPSLRHGVSFCDLLLSIRHLGSALARSCVDVGGGFVVEMAHCV